MPKPIVVPLDGSPLAESALVPAVAVARALGTRIHLLRVRESDARGTASVLPLQKPPQSDLITVAARLQDEVGPVVDVVELEGAPADAIVGYARRVNAAFLVMATRRHDGTGRSILSSVTDTVVRHAGIPVLLTGPETVPTRRSAPWECRRVLIPVDASRVSRRIIYPATRLATALGARVTLLRVLQRREITIGQPFTPFGVAFEPLDNHQEAVTSLEQIAQVLRCNGVAVDTRVVRTTAPVAEAILNEAVDARADMIALATRGHGRAGRLMFGSVAHELIERVNLPLLVQSPVDVTEEIERDHDHVLQAGG